MSSYIIGDIQGQFDSLQQLLKLIKFNPQTDRLGFVGDLVNRGPQSLQVLRFIQRLKSPLVVLGNHDLFCLMLGYGFISEDAYEHTLDDVLQASDKIELLDWLRQQPFILPVAKHNALLVHAGLPPQWSVQQSLQYAKEVEKVLRSSSYEYYLTHLFGNEPEQWDESLTGQERLRYITNAFVRMRFCTQKGLLELTTLNSSKHSEPERFRPWFDWRDSKQDGVDILFGHWAALEGKCDAPGYYALDTGCAWGNALTALRLEDRERFAVPCDPNVAVS